MNIAFDVDGCLITGLIGNNIKGYSLIEENIELVKILSKSHKVYIWSGNGWKYAYEKVGKVLGDCVSGYLNKYGTFRPDIAFDDQEINLGKLNIKV